MMICSSEDPDAPETLKEIPAKLTAKVRGGRKSSKLVNIIPDSGANICLTGILQMGLIGVKMSQLRKLKQRKQIKTVGTKKLKVLGWIPVTFEVEGEKTTQPLFITSEPVDKIYFSKKGCIDVRILPPSYPKPMPRHSKCLNCSSATVGAIDSKPTATVTPREPPPTIPPAKIPFEPIPENIPKLDNLN